MSQTFGEFDSNARLELEHGPVGPPRPAQPQPGFLLHSCSVTRPDGPLSIQAGSRQERKKTRIDKQQGSGAGKGADILRNEMFSSTYYTKVDVAQKQARMTRLPFSIYFLK